MSNVAYKQQFQDIDEQQLVQHIQRRSIAGRAALNELMRRNHTDLLYRCHRYLRNWQDAEDAAQETELRMFRAIDSFKGEASFRTWLFAIADNQCHTLVSRRMRNVMGDHLRALLDHVEETREATQLNQFQLLEQANLVERIMKSLPAQTVEILRLRFYRDHSIEDIAQILDIGLSAAKMRLYRSLRLAESLIPDQEQRLFA